MDLQELVQDEIHMKMPSEPIPGPVNKMTLRSALRILYSGKRKCFEPFFGSLVRFAIKFAKCCLNFAAPIPVITVTWYLTSGDTVLFTTLVWRKQSLYALKTGVSLSLIQCLSFASCVKMNFQSCQAHKSPCIRTEYHFLNFEHITFPLKVISLIFLVLLFSPCPKTKN